MRNILQLGHRPDPIIISMGHIILWLKRVEGVPWRALQRLRQIISQIRQKTEWLCAAQNNTAKPVIANRLLQRERLQLHQFQPRQNADIALFVCQVGNREFIEH